MRLEKLERVADELKREIKTCEKRLDDIENDIREEEKRVRTLDPRDAKFNIDRINADLRTEGERLSRMKQQVDILLDGRYKDAPALRDRVDHLHKRWSDMGAFFKTNVVEALAKRRAEAEKAARLRAEVEADLKKYMEEARRLVSWIEENTAALKDRRFPDTVNELKSLISTHDIFRSKDVPAKLQIKMQLAQDYKDLTRVAAELGASVRIDTDTTPENIDGIWNRMMAASQERDRDLMEALMRLEKLERVADELRKEISTCERRLEEIEREIRAEEQRVKTLDPRETKFNFDQIIADLRAEGDRLSRMRHNASILVEGRYKDASELNNKVERLHQKWSQMGVDFQNNVVDALERRRQELEQTLTNLRNTYTRSFEDLVAWIEEMNARLDRLKNLSIYEDKLRAQLDEIQEINEEVVHHEKLLAEIEDAAQTIVDLTSGVETQRMRAELEDLQNRFGELSARAQQALKKAQECLRAAQKFWEELNAVMMTLKEIQENLNSQEPPGIEPSAISHQQQVLGEIRQEIESTEPEVNECRRSGKDLMVLCGEIDRPEIKRQIDELDTAWETVTSLYAKRERNLADALEKAMNFHELLQNLLDFLDVAEHKFEALGPIAADINAVREQMIHLRDFKNEVDAHVVDIDALNRYAAELMEGTSPQHTRAIREPIEDINRRWDELQKAIVDRHNELERAILRLGQFQHALDELLSWIAKAEKTVRDIKPSIGDQQAIELDLAKLKVTLSDMESHQQSIETLNDAGKKIIESGGPEATPTANKLRELNARWKELKELATQKQRDLEKFLREVQAFNQEVQELLHWMTDVDQQLVASKPVGGLPETAREQLNKFLDLYHEIESRKSSVESLLSRGNEMVTRSTSSTGSLQHAVKSVKQRWDHILNRANDRKIKLEIALREALEFNEALQEFTEWLTNAEKYLSNLQPVSRVLESVSRQIEEHKTFQKDVAAHRETMLSLDKKGTHLKYFSQKQDVIVIKNMLIGVQRRWESVVSKAAERSRQLDHGLREAKEFFDSWHELVEWLKEAEKTLEEVSISGNTPEKIRSMLIRHKEFQRALGAKQASYDATMKLGRSLKDKAPRNDAPIIQEMLDELRNRWNGICNKSVDRQRKLEESLLFSGQFREAVDALLDWLERAKAELSLDRLHGDLDTVTSLVDQHKAFQADLKNRGKQLADVRKTASDLLQSATGEDASVIRSQLSTLESRWEEVSRLSVEKERRLEEALRMAEQLHTSVHSLLEFLSDAEMRLRAASSMVDSEEGTRMQIAEHERISREMSSKEPEKNRTINLAREILSKCHPDAVSTINHWISIIESRWQEVADWIRNREGKLRDHLASIKDINDLLEELMNWLRRKESDLHAAEAIPLPDDIPSIERLIDEHQRFIDDLASRQVDVERVTRAFTTIKKAAEESGRTSRTRGRYTPIKSATPTRGAMDTEVLSPRARELLDKWTYVWQLAQDRMRRLQERLGYVTELDRMKNFDFEEWRRRFLAWLNNKKARVMDFFRRIDTDNDCKVTQNEFIEGFVKSAFPTSRLEMERVAPIFDRNSDGFIDHREYLETLRATDYPRTEEEIIQDEVQKAVSKCTCTVRYKVFHVGEGKYRFGESQKLRLVRILRSTVMVRVGGGWVSLDEFLLKNDPCRAKGRTNVELREQFTLAEGVSQAMTPFVSKVRTQITGRTEIVTLPTQGPITKIREKTERSLPMFGRRGDSLDSFAEIGRSTSRLTTGTGSRPASRSASRGPSSRNGSRPASRANSDLSSESVERYTERKFESRLRFSATASGLRRTPSSGNNGLAGKERWK